MCKDNGSEKQRPEPSLYKPILPVPGLIVVCETTYHCVPAGRAVPWIELDPNANSPSLMLGSNHYKWQDRDDVGKKEVREGPVFLNFEALKEILDFYEHDDGGDYHKGRGFEAEVDQVTGVLTVTITGRQFCNSVGEYYGIRPSIQAVRSELLRQVVSLMQAMTEARNVLPRFKQDRR